MKTSISIACTCGKVSGEITNTPDASTSHMVCYCDDCQAFAHYLGRADDILDAQAGTDILQMTPARLRINTGMPELAAVRLSEKGILRWYTRCCNTPLGNTLPTGKLPFLGLVTTCLFHDKNVKAARQLFGPVQQRFFGQHAHGDISQFDVHSKVPISLILSTIRSVAKRRLRGDHKHTPLFNPLNSSPVVEPATLSTDERHELKQRCQQWAGGDEQD